MTKGVGAAGSNARIYTLLPIAGLIKRTLAVGDALWPAVGRAVDVARLARANASSVDNSLPAVWSANVVGTGILGPFN